MDLEFLVMEVEYSIQDVSHLVEGYFCYYPGENVSESKLRRILARLIEYHESLPEELAAGLEYYKSENESGPRPSLKDFDCDFREEFVSFSEEIS